MSLIKYNLNDHMVEYDNGEFEVCYCLGNDYLHYIGNGKNIHNPKGNTSCYAMFHDFKGTSLDLSNFNTHNITNMGSMFANCSNLESLYLENFDTHNVTDMSYMFSYCYNLKHLSLSKFKTNNVISMKYMFYNCKNLKLLNISQLNTESVIDMEAMFGKCENLKELDISSFYIDNTTELSDMFWYCKRLEKLKVNSDCLQFFSINRILLESGNRVSIISMSKLDKAVENLFY